MCLLKMNQATVALQINAALIMTQTGQIANKQSF